MAAPPSSGKDARIAHLLARVALGDQAAFGDLYGETSAHLYGAALRILGEAAAAEEVLQEAYVSVWHHAGSYEVAKSPPTSWLTTIVRNRCLDQLRRRGAESAQRASADDTPLHDTPGDARTPVEMLLAGAEAASARTCVEALDAGPRQAIALALYHGLSHPELARRLRVPVATAKSWVRGALPRLRNCLDGAGDARTP